MRFFTLQKTVSYSTSLNLDAYKEFVNNQTGLYVKDTQDGLQVEWKIGRGIVLIAICKLITGNDNKSITITVDLIHATFYQVIVILWIILASLWIVFEPSSRSIASVIFGSSVIIGLWGYIILNRNNLLKILSPHNIPTESYSVTNNQ